MMVHHALDLARRGLAVFPLRHVIQRTDGKGYICSCGSAKCENAGKHPHGALAPNGCKNATTDPRKIEWWWQGSPDANVGVATGKIIVVDVDPRHGGDETFRDLEPELPPTWRISTGGGGLHLYYKARLSPQIRNSAGLIGQGVDVRGVGGFVVGPGSLHQSGRRYEWDISNHPDKVPMARFPEFLQTLAVKQCSPSPITSAKWKSITQEVNDGARNNTIASLTGAPSAPLRRPAHGA